jgi:hypothetical protein
VLLAISSDEYPVIPGDVYRLTYHAAGQAMINDIMVDSGYNLNLKIFGNINCAG